MFLAPPPDRNEQDQSEEGPSVVALGKQLAHYDNSDDRDDENVHVADAVNDIARHTRSVVRNVEERPESAMRALREKHEGEKEFLNQVIRMYQQRVDMLERSSSGADI